MIDCGPAPTVALPFDGIPGTAVTAKALRLAAEQRHATRYLEQAASGVPPYKPPTLDDLAKTWM